MLPSIFPETWCLSLAEAWRAGLRVVAFDIGAQAERIRRTGRGFLLPLGLPARLSTMHCLRRPACSPINDFVKCLCASTAAPVRFSRERLNRTRTGVIEKSEAPNVRSRHSCSQACRSPSRPRDGGMQNRVAELKVSGHLMTLDTGVFCVFQAPGTPAANDWSGLPGVRISLPPGPAGRPDAISISTFRGDGWMNGSDTATLIRVAEGPAQVLVTVYQSLSAPPETAPRLQVMRLGAEPTVPGSSRDGGPGGTRAVRSEDADVVAHVQRTGDTRGHSATGSARAAASTGSRASAWRRTTGSSRRTSNTRRCWAAAGCRHGSRAASSAAAAAWRCHCSGLKIRLKGNAAKTHECSYSATFVDGSSVGPIPAGEICEAESLAALEAFQVVIHRRGGEAGVHAGPQAGEQAGGPTGAGAKPAARTAKPSRDSGPAEHGRVHRASGASLGPRREISVRPPELPRAVPAHRPPSRRVEAA